MNDIEIYKLKKIKLNYDNKDIKDKRLIRVFFKIFIGLSIFSFIILLLGYDKIEVIIEKFLKG